MRRSLRQVHGRASTQRTIAIAPARSLEARINLTPLIDVVLVLLITFMVMTPLVERELGFTLAQEKRTEQAAEIAPSQVVVTLDGSDQVQVNAESVPRARYVEHLQGLLAGRAPEDAVVFIVAGESASYASLVEAIDRAKQAGAVTVGLATEVEQ